MIVVEVAIVSMERGSLCAVRAMVVNYVFMDTRNILVNRVVALLIANMGVSNTDVLSVMEL